jgi:hypothetical protein
MKYRLIAADMDGTLLNDESKLSERTKAAIRKAVGSGALFVAATGRAMRGVENVNELFDEDMPFIVLNGASVVLGKSRKVLFKKFLDATLAKEVYDIGEGRDIPIVVWTDGNLWINREYKATSDYRSEYGAEMKLITDMDELAAEGIYKLIWFETAENVSRLQIEMKEHFGARLNCHSSRPMFLEFVGPDADKGSAMAEIGRLYGIDRSEMIAVGDGFNDISMLKYAGLGIAMANAPDEVKAVCAHVTLSNNEDGVAAVIEKYIL